MGKITFINAGAGSGKTHTLTQKLSKFIKESDDADIASKVLLTTFTKKAATEIRERVQTSLLNENLFQEAILIREANMSTVHAVCYDFIKKYWYILGIPPAFQEITESEKVNILAQVLSNGISPKKIKELSHFMNFFKFTSFDTESGFSNIDDQKWQEHVLNIIALSESNQINLNDPKHLDLSAQRIRKLFTGNTNVDQTFCKVYYNQVQKAIESSECTTKSYQRSAEKTLKLLTNKTSDFDYFLQVHKSVEKIKNLNLKNVEYLATADELPEVEISSTEPIQSNLLKYTSLIFEVAQSVKKDYSDYKKTNGIVDFNDMESYFLMLLENEEVQLDIQENIKLVMVDEFQDSNPIQLAIFRKLAKLVDNNYWVGDPKQAIYGFRGSDPILIDHVVRYFTSNIDTDYSIETLKMSWRSTPELVQFSNAIFGQSLKDQLYPFKIQKPENILGSDDSDFKKWKESISSYPYDLSVEETIKLFPARIKNDLDNTSKKIRFWDFIKESKNGDKYIQVKNDEIYEEIGERIHELLSDPDFTILDKTSGEPRKVCASDICILTFSNDKVASITETLRNQDLSVNAETSGLESTAEYRLLYQIITLFIDPTNALAKSEIQFLTGQETSIESIIEDRLQLMLDDQKEKNDWNNWLSKSEVIDQILEIKKQSKHLSVFGTIQKIISQFNLFGYLKGFDRDNIRIENTSKILDFAKSYESFCERNGIACGFNGLFNYIENLPIKERKQAKSNAKDAINVMTYHSAKGLEWPITILTSLDKDFSKEIYQRSFNPSVITKGNFNFEDPLANRELIFNVWPENISLTENTREQLESDDVFNEYRTRVLNESKRLLYVGITRARDFLFLINNKNNSNLPFLEKAVGGNWSMPAVLQQNNISGPMTHSSLDLFNIEIPIHYEREVLPQPRNIRTNADLSIKKYFRKEAPKTQSTPYSINPSKVSNTKTVKIKNITDLHERLKFSSKEISSTDQLGDALHRALYLSQDKDFEDKIREMEAMKKLEVDINEFKSNNATFWSYLNKNYAPFKFHKELYLSMMIGDEQYTGEADLILEKSEELILIDYKSFPGKSSEIEDTTSPFFAGKYLGQLSTYKKMLENRYSKPVKSMLIYYVVQGVVVELE